MRKQIVGTYRQVPEKTTALMVDVPDDTLKQMVDAGTLAKITELEGRITKLRKKVSNLRKQRGELQRELEQTQYQYRGMTPENIAKIEELGTQMNELLASMNIDIDRPEAGGDWYTPPRWPDHQDIEDDEDLGEGDS